MSDWAFEATALADSSVEASHSTNPPTFGGALDGLRYGESENLLFLAAKALGVGPKALAAQAPMPSVLRSCYRSARASLSRCPGIRPYLVDARCEVWELEHPANKTMLTSAQTTSLTAIYPHTYTLPKGVASRNPFPRPDACDGSLLHETHASKACTPLSASTPVFCACHSHVRIQYDHSHAASRHFILRSKQQTTIDHRDNGWGCDVRVTWPCRMLAPVTAPLRFWRFIPAYASKLSSPATTRNTPHRPPQLFISRWM